jgi:hypothetical protein
VCAADIVAVRYDDPAGSCVDIRLRPGVSFVSYDFNEEEAYYTETVVSSGGACKTVHELCFTVPRLDAASGSAVAGMVNASRDGLVAIATTSCGDRLLVGHTPELGAGFPLRISGAAGTTGARSTDDTARTVRLRCESISHARTVISYQLTVNNVN